MKRVKEHGAVQVPDGYELAPADGKYGWIVVFGCFISGVTSLAGIPAFSVLLFDLIKMYDSNTASISWAMSIHNNIGKILGPLATVTVNKIGCRKSAMLGSIMLSVGFAASYFANSIELLCLTFGVLAGIGRGLCLVCHTVVLSRYFRKYYGVATGILLASYSTSRLVITPMVQYLAPEYGCQGIFLVLGATALLSCVGAALFQPADWHMVLVPINASANVETKLLISSENMNSANQSGTETPGRSVSTESREPMTITLSGQSKNGGEDIGQPNEHWFQSICTKLGLDALKEPIFCLVCVNGILIQAVLTFGNVFLFPLGIEKGLAPLMLTSVISARSIVEIVSRIAGSPLVLLFGLSNRYSYIVLSISNGALMLLVDRTNTFPLFFTWVLTTSTLFGITLVLSSTLMLEVLGAKRLVDAFGLTLVFNALLMLPMTPAMGWLSDTFGSFVPIFMVLGLLQFALAALWLIEPLIRSSKQERSS